MCACLVSGGVVTVRMHVVPVALVGGGKGVCRPAAQECVISVSDTGSGELSNLDDQMSEGSPRDCHEPRSASV